MIAFDSQEPGYLSHSDAAAAPVDRFAQQKALVVGHCPQNLPSARLCVSDKRIAFTERGQRRDR
jgi:hypothetical protein